MARSRRNAPGPGRLREALAVTIAHNGLALDALSLALLKRDHRPATATGVCIGITKAVELAMALRP